MGYFGSTDPTKQGGNMKLTLIRGIPGSGKSTRAKEIVDAYTVILEADEFFYMEDGTYNFNFKFLPDAHKLCQAQAAYFLHQGVDIIISNTSINLSEIKTYWDLAKRFGAEFEIINCTENYGSIHNVPEETINRMSQNFEPITTEEFKAHAKKYY